MSTDRVHLPERAEFAIIVPLPEELEEVRKVLNLEGPITNERNYYYCRVESSDSGQKHLVVCAQCRDKGVVPATQLATDILNRWKPFYLLVVGIAGGVKGREGLALGDVVVGKPIFYYELKKQSGGQERQRYMSMESPPKDLLNVAESIRYVPWWQQIGVPRPDKTGKAPNLLIGEILSGDKLFGDPPSPELTKLLEEHDKALAVEMESGGVAHAVYEHGSLAYSPRFLTVRGISDYCGEKGSQETRNAWKAYAASAAAAVALAIIQKTKTQDTTTSASVQYMKDLERALKRFPVPSVEFGLTYESDQKQRVPVESLIEMTADAKRVILRGRAGGGKSVVFGKLSRILINKGFVPIFLDLKSWKKEYLSDLIRQEGFDGKLDVLLRTSIADLNLGMLDAFSPKLVKFVLVDGLNEVYGLDAVREILNVLSEYVRVGAPNACVLVADRLMPRPYIGSGWKKVELNYLGSDEVQKQIDATFGAGSYKNLPVNDQDLLRIPYFLNSALSPSSDSPYLGSRASSIQSFFASQMGFSESTLDCLARSAFEAYENNQSTSFVADEFAEKIDTDIWETLLSAGIVRREEGKRAAQFDHQLKHDYLASRWLVQNKDLWQPASFDAVSLGSNSFESLSMTLEQLDCTQGDDFLKRVYDWNWHATITCMANAARIHNRPYTSEMEVAVLALVAEKVFDPILRTSRRAKDVIADFPVGTAADRFKNADDLEKVLGAVNELDSTKEWFTKWKMLFMRRQADFNEDEISMIIEKDSILGWTASNVMRRFELDKGDLRQLRAYYHSYVDDDTKNSIRWRIVHAIGKFDAKENVELLFRALDNNQEYLWVRYGSARSLVEMAAITRNDEYRTSILRRLKERVRSLPKIVLDEIGYAVFYKNAPNSWFDEVIPILEEALETQKAEDDLLRWRENIENFKTFWKERHLS